VPDDDQDGPADRDDGTLGTTAAGDPPVTLAEEGVGPPGGRGPEAVNLNEARLGGFY
jgi:hypothetical protein